MRQETCSRDLPGHTSWILAVAVHLNGQLVASASNNQTVRLWNGRDGTCLRTLHGH
ncbi:hypothetical protein H6G91_37520 [Nostoc muscorum FACHB-395]|nr:hypothetical protein [Desmonostoc muscorum FACHB-395]